MSMMQYVQRDDVQIDTRAPLLSDSRRVTVFWR